MLVRKKRAIHQPNLTTHSTHFIYGYMASDIWLRTILIVRNETRCRHIGYSYRLTARVLLYASSHRPDNTYHGLCYTSRGALAGMRNSSMGGTLSNHRRSKTLGGPWTRNSEGPQNQWLFWGFILIGDPLDPRGLYTLSTLSIR